MHVFDRSEASLPMTHRSTRRAVGAAMLTLILAIVTTLIAGESQACPPGAAAATANISDHSVSKSVLVSKAFVESKVYATAAASIFKSNSARSVGRCCGGASHPNGPGCPQSGCSPCSAAAVFFEATSSFAIEKTEAGYFLPRVGRVITASPDPDFRPPRLA